MPVQNIGITALELFAYNPYRVLGVPVNIAERDLELHYAALMDMCESGAIEDYVSPYDYDDLPKMQRSIESFDSAAAKLQSNGYRCFAYADRTYAAPISEADVRIYLENITSYDCFLSCYMWLVLHDRRMTMKNLWLKLSKYIDKLICSAPDEWDKVFDARFPQEIYEGDFEPLKEFYATFCEIILLPLKELVQGTMNCYSAIEILSMGILDENEIAYDKLVDDLSKSAPEEPKKRKMRIKGAPKMKEAAVESLAALHTQQTQAEETGTINLAEEYTEDDTRLYSATLEQMLKASKAKNQIIRDIDISRVFGSGNLGKAEETVLTMDAVNTRVRDEALLKSPYDIKDNLTIEEKYKDISIDELINPVVVKYNPGHAETAAESSLGRFQAQKEEIAQSHRNLRVAAGIVLILGACAVGIVLYHETIWHWLEPLRDKISSLFD
ncbi:MAG: hypothetical protein QM689_12990 [Oscillospiraceae bacterium]